MPLLQKNKNKKTYSKRRKRVACKGLDTTDGETVRKVALIHIGTTTGEVQTRRLA